MLYDRGDHWTIGLSGWSIDRICIDAVQFRLNSFYAPDARHERWEFILSMPFRYLTAAGDEHLLEPGGPHVTLAPALALHGQTYAEVRVWKSGRLELEFRSGDVVTVEPGAYEAWELDSDSGVNIVCVPGGGEPAIWTRD